VSQHRSEFLAPIIIAANISPKNWPDSDLSAGSAHRGSNRVLEVLDHASFSLISLLAVTHVELVFACSQVHVHGSK
jgi:hypothetical protein